GTRKRDGRCGDFRYYEPATKAVCRNSKICQLQHQFKIKRTRNWILAVRRYFLEAAAAIERNRILHGRGDGIEAHALVANGTRLSDDSIYEQSARSKSTEGRSHIEALHLTHAGFEGTQSYTSGRFIFVICREQQAAFGRGVGARESPQLFVESLKA